MADKTVHVVTATFNFPDVAKLALKHLQHAPRARSVKLGAAAALGVDDEGKPHITETADMGGGKGAVIGGTAGVVLGVLGGPAVWAAAGVGALVGGLAAKWHDAGLPDDHLRAMTEHLAPGTSLVVVAVDESSAEFAAHELRHFGAEIVREIVDGQVTSEFTSLTASE
jgi:uncharacterized membrane protein